MRKIFFALSGLLMFFSASAQKFPFPQNVDYEYGYQSANLDANNALAEYENWKKKYYVLCSDTIARIDYNGNTVSEGIGYGMLVMAYMGKSEEFMNLWRYYKARMDGLGLMNWQYKGCNTTYLSSGAATDADLDVAMALLVAQNQWPDQVQLTKDFEKLVKNVQNYEFATYQGITYQRKGDTDGNYLCMNPSYFAPGYYRAFALYYANKGDATTSNFWTKAANDTYYTLKRNAHPKTGLVAAWSTINGDVVSSTCSNDASGGGTPSDYQFDACRTPWRIAVDYLWWGDVNAKMFLSKLVNFVNSPQTDLGGWYGAGGINAVVSGYRSNGKKFGAFSSAPFTGGFALAGMSANQSTADEFLLHFSKMTGDNYFNSSMALLYKLLASGNFWNPYAQTNCKYPSLGNDISLCGLANKTVTASGVDLATDKISWSVNGTPVANSGLTLSADSAAFYTVEMENGSCITRATIAVSSEVPQPTFSNFVSTCSSNTTLIALAPEFSDQFKYYWTYDGKVIPDAKEASLSADLSGVYRVYVYTENCASKYGRAYVPTTISAVDKPFSIIPTGQSITISAVTATDVEWYSDAEGVNKIGAGKSLTVSPVASTTYYMKDKASSCALSPAKVYITSDCGDMDNDGVNDCVDECPTDVNKTMKGKCGCNVAETCVDCNGVAFGTALLDICEKCAGGTTGRVAVTDIAKCTVDEQPVYTNPFVNLSPIPSKSDFVFSNTTDAAVTVIIYNCSGVVVEEFVIHQGQTMSVGNDYIKGMYLADIKSGDVVQSFKIIKE